MPTGRKKILLQRSKPPLAVLLVKFLLIRLGNLPLYLIKFIGLRLLGRYHLKKRLPRKSKLQLPSIWTQWKNMLLSLFRLPQHILYSIHSTLPNHRGRPRKTPLIAFYRLRLSRFINKKIPKSARIVAGVATLVFIFLGYTFFTFQAAYQLPNPNRLTSTDRPLTTEFYDRNGKLLYRLYEGRNRSLVKLEELPTYVAQATISIEDKNFYKHLGVDPVAMVRALHANLQNGNLEGASTITQQLIKNTLLTPERTYTRKFREAILSFWAERIYTKQEILQMYLNEVAYGGTAWGIEAATRMYFGKEAKDLNLSEATFLAGLPASPTQYSPYGPNPKLPKQRQKEVLRRMVEDEYITQEQADKAFMEELTLLPATNNIKAGHMVMYVKNLLSDKYGPRVVSQGGLKIYTTLDLDVQETAEKIVKEEVEKAENLNVSNGAAMITDPKTGQILAMVGSRAYNYQNFGNFNVATATRQPGSSIKVITYTAAFNKGFSPGNTILDTPVVFKDEWGNSYSPVNYDGTYHGPVSIRTALGSSYNTTAVRLLSTIGMDSFLQTARNLGITTFNNTKDYGLSITLGAAEVKMIDMMGVYGTFANMGTKHTPTAILKVVDSEGSVLEEYEDQGENVLPEEVAYLITDVLADNKARTPAFGPNSLLNIKGYSVPVKTGTSDNKKDNWTFGYTPDYVVGVWVGNNDGSFLHPSLASGVTGASPIWSRIITSLIAEKPPTRFARPSGLEERMVDGRKDLVIANNLPKKLVRTTQEKNRTTFLDSFSSYATTSGQVSN